MKLKNGFGGPVTKLSSIESRPSSSEPDIVPNSLDESRQKVYGTKTRRGSKPTRSLSSKRSSRSKITPSKFLPFNTVVKDKEFYSNVEGLQNSN